jgi:hypothetical protein
MDLVPESMDPVTAISREGRKGADDDRDRIDTQPAAWERERVRTQEGGAGMAISKRSKRGGEWRLWCLSGGDGKGDEGVGGATFFP